MEKIYFIAKYTYWVQNLLLPSIQPRDLNFKISLITQIHNFIYCFILM
jgi:hypothetical protein